MRSKHIRKNMRPNVPIIESIWFPILLGVFVAAISICFFPFLPELPSYLQDVKDILETGKITHSFNPVGYPVLLIPGFLLGGEYGIVIEQAMIYVVFLLIIFINMRTSLEYNYPYLIVLMAVLAFHPYLILNIHRINDSGITILFLSILLRWIITENGILGTKYSALLYGGIIGLYVVVRPNTLIFQLIAIYGFYNEWKSSGFFSISKIIVFFLSFIFCFCLVSYIGTGSVFYWPGNGPYNLFAGNNPYSMESFIVHGNGEQSIGRGLAYYGVDPINKKLSQIESHVYIKYSFEYISNNLLATFENWAMKLWVFFSPNFRHSDNIFEKAIQIGLIMPFIVWVFSIYLFIRKTRSLNTLITPLLFFFLFIIPFIATNSDSRFRMPVFDVFFIVHCVWLLHHSFKSKINIH